MGIGSIHVYKQEYKRGWIHAGQQGRMVLLNKLLQGVQAGVGSHPAM